ncbi:hypothetical protein AVEN_155099-1 [Araneus ventricosus]|uniref:Uncharacterized protein n=1 Tax=Araneus ventricosus TaxID=182803 RepID=A0A4Y2A7L0_ARAVE|nr:hypothetical protein AVEN_155099-1 [Araneus ventricosus]
MNRKKRKKFHHEDISLTHKSLLIQMIRKFEVTYTTNTSYAETTTLRPPPPRKIPTIFVYLTQAFPSRSAIYSHQSLARRTSTKISTSQNRENNGHVSGASLIVERRKVKNKKGVIKKEKKTGGGWKKIRGWEDTRMKKVGLLFLRISIHFFEGESLLGKLMSLLLPHAQITYNPCKENALKDF